MAAWVRDLHFPRLDILITIDAIYQVTPAGPVPAADGDSLYLSNLDDMVGSRVFTPTVYFYSENNQREPIAKVFRRALANVLVPYYPLSGRLRETIEGKLEVFFGPDQGALMVEARSSLKLADLGDLRVPNPAWAPLIYRFPVEGAYQVVNMPLVIAQLTTFSCGGFSLGLRLCHCVCDGLGAMQFVAAWATLAKVGPASKISPSPCWDREFFRPRVPPTVKFPHKEFARMEEGSSLGLILSQAKLVQKCYSVSREFQARLKRLAQSDGEDARTGFDAVAAHVWRSWVKAIGIRPLDYELRLSFSVNARPKLRAPPLKEGFYGNALCVACATSTAARLAEGTLSAAAGRVREARVAVSEEYMRSTVDYLETHRPTRLEFAGKLSITQWTRFSMYESSDFGWGRPLYAGPIDLTPTPQICVLLPDGDASGGDGSLVVWICLPEYATVMSMLDNDPMTLKKSLLNLYADPFVPLLRGADKHSKSNDISEDIKESPRAIMSMTEICNRAFRIAESHVKDSTLKNPDDETERSNIVDGFEYDLAFLTTTFPGVSNQFLIDVYFASGGDMDVTIEMMN